MTTHIRRNRKKILPALTLLSTVCLTGAEPVKFSGVISNSFFIGNRLVEKARRFEVTVDGPDSAYIVEDAERGTVSRATFTGGEYSHTFKGPFTNKSGQVSTPIAARIEHRLHPRDDGSWVNYLWLGFGSHHYFTSRVNQAVEPIWLTGLHESNEDKLGLRAFYAPIPGTSFPQFVAYVTDGYEYFEGKQSGTLQRKQLRHPYDAGFTNILLHLHAYTNLDSRLFPTEFEISRFAVQNMWQTNASLKLLVRSKVLVASIEQSAKAVAHPEFPGQVYALDARASTSEQKVHAVHVPMTNGNWPDSSVTVALYERQKKLAEIAKSDAHNQGSKRNVIRAGLLLFICLPPLALLGWYLRGKLGHRARLG